jgi:hypothetical protein
VVELKLNGTHQLLFHAEDFNLLADNINTMKKNTETSTDASKDVGLEVNTKKTKYMFLSYHQNVGQNHNINIGSRYFENVAQLKHLGTAVTNQNLIQEEIKRTLNSGNASFHSAQKLLFSRLLCKNIKIRIYKILILPVALYGCETWSLALREEHRLRVFKNRMLRRLFGLKRSEVLRGLRKLHSEELCNLYSSPSII